MKESYIRSKVELRPLNTNDFGSKKNIVDYQEYEQQLSYYQKSKRGPDISQLFDWTKPSEILSLKKPVKPAIQEPQPQVMQNNSMNTQELLRSEHGSADNQQNDSDLSDSIDVQIPSNSKPTYVQQVKADYGSEYRIMSTIKIENELKQMRQRIMQMNKKLNKMLDRYELLAGTMPKKEVQIQNPYKFLAKQIEINNSLVEKQAWQIKQIEFKDQQLQKKDYLVELDELIIQLKKQIHDIEKEKHTQSVDVQKIDKQLQEIQSIQQDGEEYKQVKELKALIVYYFKKLNDQKLTEQQLQNQIFNLTKKEVDITNKLNQLAQIAIDHNLQVSTNKNYNQLKRRHDELIVTIQCIRKKKEVQLKSININQEKLQKDIVSMRKELQKCEMDIQEAEYKSMSKDQETNTIISKNNLLTRQMRSISYRFDSSLIHGENTKFKPNFKRASTKLQNSATNKTIDIPRQSDDRRFYSINDKNSVPQFIQEYTQNNNSSSETSNSRLKPILRSWKGKPGEKQRYIASPQKYNTIERSNIFKPPPLLKAKK